MNIHECVYIPTHATECKLSEADAVIAELGIDLQLLEQMVILNSNDLQLMFLYAV